MKKSLVCVTIMMGAGAASAQNTTPTMTFLAAPAVAGAAGQPAMRQLQRGDTATIVLRDSAACGQRASSPAFEIQGDELQLHYRLPAMATQGGGCVATSVFTFKGLPDRALRIAARADRDDGQLASTTTPPMPTPGSIWAGPTRSCWGCTRVSLRRRAAW